ncbi:MAG: twin-arginine translocase TatA/TatE family subunit [Rhodospirillaceae bacterium]|nr:twin-arginine translocase TatA/TatE family subunit [Rhodospirillaceae bacterium]MDH5489916.1 twin-arginine translocase TatA/TatE family subunit [Rhodospirillaceae bacterium]MDH5771837.1 twin-arginine translocase TatA/TatE family subunit [Rhodospirillaceae bacterium]
MGAFGIWQWVVVLAIVLLLFGGRGKISALMGDFGKGLRSFKKGLKDGEGEESGSDEKKPIEGSSDKKDDN